jgi:hypothetical protein
MPGLTPGATVYLSLELTNDHAYLEEHPLEFSIPVDDFGGVRVLLPKTVKNTVEGKTFDLSKRLYRVTYKTDEARFAECSQRNVLMDDDDWVFHPADRVFCGNNDPGYEERNQRWLMAGR